MVRGDVLFESTGRYGESAVRMIDLNSGEVLASVALGDEYFGEGLELVGDRLIQLTWREGTAFIWDASTLEPLGTFAYEGQGWGLCALDGRFYMSDGSAQLSVRDVETFAMLDTVEVRFEGEPVAFLNELECTPSGVYANVWKTDTIVVIDPNTGDVFSRIDASAIREPLSTTAGIDVLNGMENLTTIRNPARKATAPPLLCPVTKISGAGCPWCWASRTAAARKLFRS